MNPSPQRIIISDQLISVFFLITIISLIGVILHFTNASASPSSSSNSTDSFWTNATWMPTPRSESAVALLENKIYVAGGESEAIKKTNVVEVYDLKTKKWSTAAPLPIAMNHVGIASHSGKLYAAGGTHDNGYSNRLFIYDPKTNKWS